MRKKSRAALWTYLLAGVLTLAWAGFWASSLAGGQDESVGLSVARAILLVAPILVGVGWLLAGGLKRSGRADQVPDHVADLALIDDLNRAANLGESRDELLTRLAEGTRSTFSSHGATVYLLDGAGEYLTLLSNPIPLLHGTGITLPARLGTPRIKLAGSTWYARALGATGPIVTSSFDEIVAMAGEFEGAEAYRAILPTVLRTRRTSAVMTAPVLSGHRVLGVVDMGRNWPFTDEEAERFQLICEEVGVVLAMIAADVRLSESEGLYRALTELTPDMVFVVDDNMRVVLANSAAARFLHRTPEQLKGARVAELFGPLGAEFENSLSRVAATGRSSESEDWTPAGDSETWLRTSLVPLADVMPGCVLGISRDVTVSKRLEEALRAHADEAEHLATHDALTGIENRRAFVAAVGRALALARRGTSSTVFFMDVDHFKQCNDERGHTFGDEVLVSVAGLLKEQVREVDLVARIGGDEFAALIAGSTESEALAVAKRMRASVERLGDDIGIPIGLAIGIVGVDADASIDSVIAAADHRMYEYKMAHHGAREVAENASSPRRS
jgi:diguanylate cyclase (GGDEF)-like protein/PAS domain S-box-containing protein